MAEYRIKGGGTLTDEDVGRLGEACERGDYPGEPGDWVVRPQGRPSLSDEPGWRLPLAPDLSSLLSDARPPAAARAAGVTAKREGVSGELSRASPDMGSRTACHHSRRFAMLPK